MAALSSKPIKRPGLCKTKFALFWMLATGSGGGEGHKGPFSPSADCPLSTRTMGGGVMKGFIDRGRGCLQKQQSALTVILKLVISGLISIIFIVLGTVNFQFPGALVPISLRPILGIMAASGSSVQEVAESQRPPSNWAQHSHRIRSLGNWSPLGCKATTLT